MILTPEQIATWTEAAKRNYHWTAGDVRKLLDTIADLTQRLAASEAQAQAEIAAAYEDAAQVAVNYAFTRSDIIPSQGVAREIRAKTPASAKAALDAQIKSAEARGRLAGAKTAYLRCANNANIGNDEFVYRKWAREASDGSDALEKPFEAQGKP